MVSTSAKNGDEFKKLDGIGFGLWKVITESTLYLQGCVDALQKSKTVFKDDDTWKLLNCMVIVHIYVVITDEVGRYEEDSQKHMIYGEN